MDRKLILEKLSQVPYWFQRFEVAPGIFTPGAHDVVKMVQSRLNLPESLEGLSVLDIGAYDGGMSFICERLGASRVVAYDLYDPNETGFATASDIIGSRVEYCQGSVYKLDPDILGKFDIVLFAGVLYHLRYPVLAIDKIRTVVKDRCYVETQVLDNCVVSQRGNVPMQKIAPKIAQQGLNICQFYEGAELNGDPSNWFSPTVSLVMSWFRTAGFDITCLSQHSSRATFLARVTTNNPPFLGKSASYEGRVSDNSDLSVL